MSNNARHSGVRATSASFMKGLDRSTLGRFVNREMLNVMDVIEHRGVLYADELLAGKIDNELYNCPVDMNDIGLSIFDGELFWSWWFHTGEAIWETQNPLMKNNRYANVRKRVVAIIQHQNKHEYFEADIWDIPFIERCIADGIDPTIAMTLAV